MKTIRKYSTPIRSLLHSVSEQDEAPEVLTLEEEYNDKNLLVLEKKYSVEGELEEVHSYTYDDKGRLLIHLLEIPEDGIFERFVTTRNAEGEPTMIVKYYGDDEGEKVEYVYGENAQVVKIMRYDADGEFEAEEDLEYDDQSKLLVRKITSPSDGNKCYRFSYDENSNLIKEEDYDEDDQLSGYVEIHYDEENRETYVTRFNQDRKMISQLLTEYDELGRVKRKIAKSAHVRISSFDYDEQGRVIEESLSDQNDFVISRTRLSYDDEGRIAEEIIYETDLTRSGRDTHLSNRFEYLSSEN
jgi:YD repeat-containing protein